LTAAARPSRVDVFMRVRILLGTILLVAAVGRFTALGWGLRHVPEPEERLFVENVRLMLKAGDLDHRFYEYPGLFLYLLAPFVAAVEPPGGSVHPAQDDVAAAPAYRAARAVVAFFGVLSVALVFLLGRRLADERVGLIAAALLAVSPFEIETAHTVRPDVVLETFVLAALLAFTRVGARRRDDAVAGLALGTAAAVKFTGGLLVAVYLVARWITPGPRVQGTLVAGLVSMATWALLTPYALITPQKFLAGTADQWNYHYRTGAVGGHFLEFLGYYLSNHARGLGLVAGALAVVGLLWTIARPPRREWLPVAAWPLVLLGVLSTADMRYGRLSLSLAGVASLLAARTIAGTTARWPAATVLAAAVAVAIPLRSSILYIRDVSGPIPSDITADWIHANVPARSVILCRLEWLGIDQNRYEVVRSTGFPDQDRLGAMYADYVVDGARDPFFQEFAPVFATERISTFNGDRLAVRRVPPERRRVDHLIPLAGARWSASSKTESAAAAGDGRLEVAWSTAAPQRPGDWLQVELPAAVEVTRVELMTAGKDHRAAQELLLWVRDAEGTWHRWPFAHARPPVEHQPPKGRSQVLVFQPVRTSGLRLEQLGRGKTRWAVAEVRLGGPEAARKYDARPAE
jgi:hypothetical protein